LRRCTKVIASNCAFSVEQLTDWRNRHPTTTFVVIAGESDEWDTLDALYAGASAILPPWAESTEIATAIDVTRRGLALLPRHVLERLLDASSPTSEESRRDDGASRVSLTPREHEVLAAMADGASNKVIARRLESRSTRPSSMSRRSSPSSMPTVAPKRSGGLPISVW